MSDERLKKIEERLAKANDLRLSAYYYGFSATGQPLVDIILSAVACAGKAYHHTDNWCDETTPYEPCFRGASPVEWMQRAAEDAAFMLAEKDRQIQALREALTLARTVRADEPLTQRKAELAVIEAARRMARKWYDFEVRDELDAAIRSLDTSTGRTGK